MKYRAEIDGLRAVAVIPVILFHAGVEFFSGGYVGVDVFFVISGYLITTIILSEQEKGTFSLVHFYERRARRILPALFLVMLACLPFARAWFLPSDREDFFQSLVAVACFVSNILFMQEAGYWDTASELKPLLHTWSLAIEEQYYVLFPLFLLLMWRFERRWILGSFIAIAVASLLLAEWGAHHWPVANFFLLSSRGWELAIGACIAFYFLYRKQAGRAPLSNKLAAEMPGLAGLLMIGYAVVAFDETVPFPGFSALLPTAGTALVILFASSQTLAGRILGTRLLVGIGLISYSAYLWHQPLLAFARYRVLTEPGTLTLAVLALLSFPLAYFSWKYVEQPFRDKKSVSRKNLFMFAASGTIIFIVIGAAGLLAGNFKAGPDTPDFSLDRIDQKLVVNTGLSRTCDLTFTLAPECRTSDEPEILVWGDSFAMHLVRGIQAAKPDAKIIQMTKSVCGPFFDIAPVLQSGYTMTWAGNCLAYTEKVREWLKTNNTVKYAVLSSGFNAYLSGNSKLLYRNGDLVDTSSRRVENEFEKTLAELESMGITPVIFSPTPANGNNLGRCLANAERRGLGLELCDFPVGEITRDRINVFQFLENFEENHRVVYLDELMCDESVCKTHAGPDYLYRDSGHLSLDGSTLLGKKHDFYRLITDADYFRSIFPLIDRR